jgi:hypothetical protein
MLSQSQRTAILELDGQGVGKREIARVLGVSRISVRRVLRARSAEVPELDVGGSERRGQNGSAILHQLFAPPFPLFNRLGTVLAVKGSLRRAQQRRALDGSGPFQRTSPEMRERLYLQGG